MILLPNEIIDLIYEYHNYHKKYYDKVTNQLNEIFFYKYKISLRKNSIIILLNSNHYNKIKLCNIYKTIYQHVIYELKIVKHKTKENTYYMQLYNIWGHLFLSLTYLKNNII